MNPLRQKLTGIAAGVALMGAGAAGAYALTGSASAATSAADTTTAPAASSSTPAASSSTPAASTAPADSQARPQRDPSKGGHVANGITETLLTGTTADQAKAAALAAVSGGTVERVENDAEGATYEAHMVKADGSHVTVKMDASFKVTSIENH